MGLFNKIKNIFKTENIEENVSDIPEKVENKKKSVEVYEKGLTKSREGFVSRLASLTNKYKKATDEYFDELEEILIMADIGVNTVTNFIEKLRDRVKHEKIESTEDLKEIIIDELFIIYVNEDVLVNKINFQENGPTVVLFVGVNGVGKTTTIGKLAQKFKNEGKKVLLVPADTFRAAAVEQLTEWANRVGVDISDAKEGEDPSSVVHRALEGAKNEKYDIIIIDTAGRLHNKKNLMAELGKINNTIDKVMKDEILKETYLVLDGTTGQNAIEQSKAFSEVTNITGYILTKLDGTSKGGVIIGIADPTKIPVKYIGVGEKQDDLKKFDAEDFVRAVIS